MRKSAKNQQNPILLGHNLRARGQERSTNAHKTYEDVKKRFKR